MTYSERILTAMTTRFPNNIIAPEHYGRLLIDYLESGLSPPHIVAEIETGDEHKFWSSVWEAMLYRHLCASGYAPRNIIIAAGQQGPDFGIEHDGKTIWLEAVVPEPKGIPADWLEPPGTAIRVRTKPDTERVVRCTSVLWDKQKKFVEYQAEGVVGPNDCLVIALNICRLSDWDLDGAGISQLPLSMEALFGLGPLGVPITRDGNQAGPAQHVSRFTIPKANGAAIPSAYFFDPAFASISAVIQAHQKDMHQRDLILQTIHNPTPTNVLPKRLFGARSEFVSELRATDCLISDIAT